MSNVQLPLVPVDRVEILTLMDNYVDMLLPSTEVVQRPILASENEIPTDTFVAEHGLSLLVTVYKDDTSNTVLLDTGWSPIGVLHNMDLLKITPDKIEAIVLSHAHMDHTGTLLPLLDQMERTTSLVVHPNAFLSPRYIVFEDGRRLMFPKTLDKKVLKDKGADIVLSEAPVDIAEGKIGVTGQVERVTTFEKGLPNALMEKDGQIVPDPILDDQSLVINLKGKGLVVIAGCSHAGIINTLLHARKITGVDKVYAVLGGFHLSGAFFEPIIEDTLREFKRMNPEVLVPMHCTGWKAIHRFEKEFPEAFILSSVGSKFTLAS